MSNMATMETSTASGDPSGSIVATAQLPSTSGGHCNRKKASPFHSLFYSPDELSAHFSEGYAHGNRRVCRVCFPNIEEVPRCIKRYLDKGIVGWQIKGFVVVETSASHMGHHFKVHHRATHSRLTAGRGLVADPSASSDGFCRPCSYEHTSWFVRCLVVVDLQPFSIVSHSGMRKMLDTWKPGVGGQEEVKQAFDHIVTTCKQRVKEVIASLVSQGLHFTMTGDVWKTAGPVRRTYHVLFVHFVDEKWQRHDMCVGVVELERDQDPSEFKAKICTILQSVGIPLPHVFALMTDPEGSVRKGFEKLYDDRSLVEALSTPAIVNCGCQSIQLQLNHLLPHRKEQKVDRGNGVAGEDEGASGSTGFCIEVETDVEENPATEEGEPKRKKSRKLHRDSLPHMPRLHNKLQTLLDPIRAISVHFSKSPAAYTLFQDFCVQNKLALLDFPGEDLGDWGLTYELIVTHLHNARALTDFHDEHPLPVHLRLPTEVEYTELQHIAAILYGMKFLCQVFDRPKSFYGASHYLPMMEAAIHHTGAAVKLLLPPDCGSHSTRGDTNFLLSKDLASLAKSFRSHLHDELKGSLTKHTSTRGSASPGKEILETASFLDPRHKALKFMAEEKRKSVQKKVKNAICNQAEEIIKGSKNGTNSVVIPAVTQAVAKARSKTKSRKGSKEDKDDQELTALEQALVKKLNEEAEKAKSKKELKRELSETDMFTYKYGADESHPDATSSSPTEVPEAVRVTALVEKDIAWYLTQPTTKQDPLEWWKDAATKNKASIYTLTYVKQVLAIPGCTASLTRGVGLASAAINVRLTSLEPERADDVMYAHHNELNKWL